MRIRATLTSPLAFSAVDSHSLQTWKDGQIQSVNLEATIVHSEMLDWLDCTDSDKYV